MRSSTPHEERRLGWYCLPPGSRLTAALDRTVFLRVLTRQPDSKHRTGRIFTGIAPVGRCNGAAVALYQPYTDPQAQAVAIVFGGEERAEQSFPGGVAQTRTRIADFTQHTGATLRVGLVDGAQRQRAALRHGLNGVDHQVNEHALQFLAVNGREPCGSQRALDMDVGVGQQMLDQHQ